MNRGALRELIEERKRATGRSYAEIAKCGGGVIGRAAVHRLATKDITHIPDPETIEALGRGLDIEPAAILRAAGEAVGIVAEEIKAPSDANSLVIVAGLSEMTEEERATVARMVEGLLRASGRDK